MIPVVVTPPPCQPIDLADVRQHVKQDITDDDAMLAIYLASAVDFAEKLCTKQLVSARFALRLPGFPCGKIKITRGPVVAIESIQYYDAANLLQTLDGGNYRLNAVSAIAEIDAVSGIVWPGTADRSDAVIVTFIAGYVCHAVFDSAADTVTLKNWPALQVGDVLRLSNSGGTLPTGLASRTDYYVQSVVSSGIYKLAATDGGEAITLSNTGAGLHFAGQAGINFSQAELPATLRAWLLLRCDTQYSHRGENVITRGNDLAPLPYVDRLLDNDRLWL